jgi:cytochrome bd ubiquinol oxidase subunit I
VSAFPIASVVLAGLLEARVEMAITLGLHIVLASLGVGMPLLMTFAEWRAMKTGDAGWRRLARRWSEAFAVLFAVGAVSGTILTFELGLLWPGFMGRFGSVIGLPFTLEAFAFFLEAVFLGIYLYGWDRVGPRVHLFSGVVVAVAGAASAVFVVTANAWMNAPTGFTIVDGKVVDVRPFEAMTGPAAGAQATHMLLAAYVVAGFLVAGVYALRRLRGHDGLHERRATGVALALALGLMPLQVWVGDWAGKVVAKTQPVKFAAMEGQFKTEARAPLRIGGLPDEEAGVTRFAIEIPGGLSWLAHGDADAVVVGLDAVPPRDRPPVAVVHLAFQAMVGAGSAMLLLAVVAGVSLLRKRRLPSTRAFLLAVVAGAPLSVVALEAGWIVTEVGRQPWIVQGVMRVEEAVTQAPGTGLLLVASLLVYGLLAAGTTVVLLRLARRPLEGDGHGA